MYEVTCKECGKKYFAEKNADGYCEVCRSRKITGSRHKYYEKRKENKAKVKGTLVKCEQCGKLFSPVNSAQKLCESCQYLKEIGYKMTASNNYRKENNDVIQFKVKKGERDKLRQYASDIGMNLTELLLTGIETVKYLNSLPDDKRREIEAQIHLPLNKNKNNS